MLRKILQVGALLSLSLIAGSLWAGTGTGIYQRGAINPNSPYANLKSPPRLGWVAPKMVLPGRSLPKQCIPHGQARCIGTYKPSRFYNRYANPLAEQTAVNPRLRGRPHMVEPRNF